MLVWGSAMGWLVGWGVIWEGRDGGKGWRGWKVGDGIGGGEKWGVMGEYGGGEERQAGTARLGGGDDEMGGRPGGIYGTRIEGRGKMGVGV